VAPIERAHKGRRQARRAAAKGLAVFSLLGAALAAQPAAAARSLSTEIAACHGIDDTLTRLGCYDRVAAAVDGRDATLAEPASAGDEDIISSPVERAPSRPMAVVGKEAQPSSRPAAGPQATGRDPRPAWLGVRPYRRNYLLVASYNDNTNRDFPDESVDLPFVGDALDNVEMKFQISFEVPVWRNLLRDDLDLYFAYTQLSFFQAYNQEYSAPFRETNYEPELGLHWRPDLELLGWRLDSARVAMNHQSNGRSEPLSRSWNRLIGDARISRDDLSLGLRLWSLLGDRDPTDNPDITDYYGYGELYAGYQLGKHNFGLMLRNPIDAGAVQLDWSYPLSDTVRFYVQYFNGYGESLLDYDHPVNRIGVGFSLNPWP